jgi:formate dehydrogenase major subunit
MAECHPVGFQWVMKAKERGATIIHVDPRFTRTGAMADIHVPIRPGTDIAFLGGLIHYIIENERYLRDYVVEYTNAAAIVNPGYQGTEDLDGFFAGWDAERGEYDHYAWMYENPSSHPPAGTRSGHTGQAESERAAEAKATHFDRTLQHPRCVFQVLKRHYQRYTPEMVETICGIPQALFLRVAQTLCDNSGRDRTSAFCYAVGWTQHAAGPQMIRAAGILQALLGNIGRPGGGILALRGHASIQGSTDIPTLYNLLPGYLAMPKAKQTPTFEDYCEQNVSPYGWWSESRKYIVSLLKAWFGEAATEDNGWCYDHLPHLQGEHSHLTSVVNMIDRVVKGYFVMGENPVVGSPNSGLQREGLRNLEWLVVRDFAPTETAEFWKDSPEHRRGEVRTQDIATEVFFFPAATHVEKSGTFTNTQRLLQWREKAIEPPGDSRSELHFIYYLGVRLKQLYADAQDHKDRGIRDLTWTYPTEGQHKDPDAEAVLREINGWTVADGKAVNGYTQLKDDGSTACGCWIYSGVFKGGENQAANRKPASEQDWVAAEWGWSWPANRRILYNRASADPDGNPWSERKKLVWWDAGKRQWTGLDNPDMILDRAPDYQPAEDAMGTDALAGTHPFLMNADGQAWLFAPHGLQQGPLPTHYEPPESIIRNPLYAQQCDPTRIEYRRERNSIHRAYDDRRFPHILTTYRLTEHHTAGAMSRWLSWLSELQPEAFCEVSPQLAREAGLRNGEWVTISTARAAIEVRVLVTRRLQPMRIGGRTFHVVGVPYHWGNKGRSRGDSANELVAFVADSNVSIMESKAMTCNIVPGRHAKEFAPLKFVRSFEDDMRDLPQARSRPIGKHGIVAGRSKQGDQT